MPILSLIFKPRGLAASIQSSSVSCREISMEDVNETELTMKNQKLPGTDQPKKCWIPDSIYLFIVLSEFGCLCSLWLRVCPVPGVTCCNALSQHNPWQQHILGELNFQFRPIYPKLLWGKWSFLLGEKNQNPLRTNLPIFNEQPKNTKT